MNDPGGPNADGLDIDCVQNALIEENFFDVDDDALCVKSGRDWDGRQFGRPARDILFRNNVIGRGHGITVGSETSGSVFNVTFENITMANTGTGIRMKTERGRGGIVSDVTYRNIHMHEIQGECVQITLNYHAGLAPTNKTGTPVFKNILLENVHCNKGATSFFIDGLPEQSIHNLTLRNVTMGKEVGKEGKCDFVDCTCDELSTCPSCCLAKGKNRTKCKAGANLGCYASEKDAKDPLLPTPHDELHDHVTLEGCAAKCFADNLTVAGILAANHCSCGSPGALATSAARGQKRPMAECVPSNCSMKYGDGCACTGNPMERCGAASRILAYEVECTKAPGLKTTDELCPVFEQSNNIVGMITRANESTDIVKNLGIMQSEAECRRACEECVSGKTCRKGTECLSWTWHHPNFGGDFAGHCYARLDEAWPPSSVGKPVSSQWMREKNGHCDRMEPGPTPWVQHSWDTVPVFVHTDNVTGPFTNEAIEFLAKSFAMVTIEKYQGPNAGGQNTVWRPTPGPVECCEEDRIVETFRRMKKINSNLTTILYLNSVLDFPQYRLHELIKANPHWWLNTSEGVPLMMSGDGHPNADMMAYDMRIAGVRELFKQACLNYTKDGTVDGCFIDRAIDGFTQGSATAEMLTSHKQMLSELQKALGHQPLIANHAYNLSHVNSAQIEAGGPNSYSLTALLDAAANDKLVQFHIEYGYPAGPAPDFANSYEPCDNATMFTNALATFLVGAGDRAYFGCFPWHSTVGWPELKEKLWHEEYDKPLGKPREPAVLSGKTWRREFESGTVVTLCCKGDALYTGHIDWGKSSADIPHKSDDTVVAAVPADSKELASTPQSVAHITTTSAMRDASGVPITDCLEPHIQKFGDTYYAYGFTTRNQPEQFATTIYSSDDLVAWSRRAYIPVNKTLDGPLYGEAISLWYVVYNNKTKLYMGYGADYGKSINVYSSAKPIGPFLYVRNFSTVYPYAGAYTGAGDILIYTEGFDAYMIYNSMPAANTWSSQHRFTYIYKLNEAWDDIIVASLVNTTAVMEGLWLFKRQGTYFLLGSHLSGYAPNDNFYLTATAIKGPWTNRGLIAPNGTKTYDSQTFQGLTVSGSKGDVFAYIGHRYLPCGPPPVGCDGPFTNASNIWLPLEFSGDLLSTPLTYRDEWILDLDGAWNATARALKVDDEELAAGVVWVTGLAAAAGGAGKLYPVTARKSDVKAVPAVPADWVAAVARGDMLVHAGAEALDRRLLPDIGNGFLATIAGSRNVYLAGVFNLVPAGEYEPFRARLPGLAAMSLDTSEGKPEPPGIYSLSGVTALDMARAAYLQRKTVAVSDMCTVAVEQRTYAHRSQLALLVTDFVLTASPSCPAGTQLIVKAGVGASPTEVGKQDFSWKPMMGGGVFAGTTLKAEKMGRLVSAAFATKAPCTGTVELAVTAGKRVVHSFPTAFVTDVDEQSEPVALAKLASSALASAVSTGADDLFAQHVAAVDRSHGVDIDGDMGLAQVINATTYALSTALSQHVEWSTAPGGLATGGRFTADGKDTKGGQGYPEGGSSYYGHVFWDADVWMLPAMLPLHPNISRAMIAYRFRTMQAAEANAKKEGHNGTKWAWESAFSGISATGGDCQEIHLQAGIAMAIRAFFRLSHDVAWLENTAWPMLANIVAFFRSRSTAQPDGSIALLKVQSPNEYASGIDNDIYTNSAYVSVLQWVAVVAKLLGKPEPGQYKALASRIVIPFNVTLGRHEEYTSAPEALRIKQSTETMVPYPVGFPMPKEVQRRDLVYEAAHIGDEGPAMTHSMLAIDWLSMGNKTGGDIEFARSYDTNLVGPYLQWVECPIPPDYCQGHRPATSFLTAAGGFQQAVHYGYAGLRYNDENATVSPTLVGNASSMTVRGLHYCGAELRLHWTASETTLTCTSGCPPRLCAESAGAAPKPLGASPLAFSARTRITVSWCN